jgi:SHS family lactate transporter-like MFS transporter
MMTGSIAMGWLASKRGATIALALPASVALAVLPLYVGHVGDSLALGALLAGVFGVGFCGVTPLLLTGLFPAAGRARFVGIVYHVGALFAGFVPMGIAALSKVGHMPLSRSLWLVCSVLELGLVLLVLAYARRGQEVDSASTLAAEVVS